MPQPPAVHRIADPLVSAYERAWRRVLAEQQRIADDPARMVRRRRLEEVSRSIAKIMDRLDAETGDWIAKEFPRIYLAGLVDTARDVGIETTWTAIHQKAVEELAYRVYDDLLEATRHVRESTKLLIREVARAEGTFSLVGGETAEKAGRTMARILAEKGITAVTYKNGAKHGLAEYSEMNLRTTTALGYNHGSLNAAPDILYWEVFDGPECGWTFHDDPELANGKITTRDDAFSWPIAHPRCRRAFGARMDITTPKQIEELGLNPLTVGSGQTTFAQRAAQQAQDRVRAGRGARTPRTGRGARTPRRAA